MNKQEWVGTWPISGDRQQIIKVAAMWNLRGVTVESWCNLPLAKRKGQALTMRGLGLGRTCRLRPRSSRSHQRV